MTRLLIVLGAAALSACASQPEPQDTHLAQEQHACAEIGIAPGDPAYPRCIANLDAALFGIDKIAAGE